MQQTIMLLLFYEYIGERIHYENNRLQVGPMKDRMRVNQRNLELGMITGIA